MQIAERFGPAAVRPWYAYTLAFTVGAVIMGLEVLGFRLLAPAFGYSVYVSGGLLGVVMVALSAGYYAGGAAADRRRCLGPLMACLSAAAIYLVAVLLLYPRTLGLLAPLGEVRGALAAAAVIFFPPMALMGITSPYLVSLLAHGHLAERAREARPGASAAEVVAREDRPGRYAGTVYALSTAGSILGVFLTTFLLIPRLGTRLTLVAWTAGLVAPVLGHALLRRRPAALMLPLLLAAAASFEPPRDESVVHEKDSLYNLVRVVRTPEYLALRLNQDTYDHSRYRPGSVLLGSYYDYFAVAPLLAQRRETGPPEIETLILGLGAGSSVRQLLHFFPGMRIDGVEIDPEVVRAAREHFELDRHAGLRVVVDDARPFLAGTDRRYDVVEIDLFHGGPYVPFYLLTREFFTMVRSALRDGGVAVMNVYVNEHDASRNRLRDGVVATLLEVFPEVLTLRVGPNDLLFALGRPVPAGDAAARLAAAAARPEFAALGGVLGRAASGLRSARGTRGTVFTDDRAPVERLTRVLLESLR